MILSLRYMHIHNWYVRNWKKKRKTHRRVSQVEWNWKFRLGMRRLYIVVLLFIAPWKGRSWTMPPILRKIPSVLIKMASARADVRGAVTARDSWQKSRTENRFPSYLNAGEIRRASSQRGVPTYWINMESQWFYEDNSLSSAISPAGIAGSSIASPRAYAC